MRQLDKEGKKTQILHSVINGSIRRDDCCDTSEIGLSVSVNRSSFANVEKLLVNQFIHDFPEKPSEEKQEMSQEDIQFMDCVNETVKMVDGHCGVCVPSQKQRAAQRISKLYV